MMIPYKKVFNSNLDLHLNKLFICLLYFTKFIKISSKAQERKKFFIYQKILIENKINVIAIVFDF